MRCGHLSSAHARGLHTKDSRSVLPLPFHTDTDLDTREHITRFEIAGTLHIQNNLLEKELNRADS